MIYYAHENLKAYFFSDYEVDKTYQGFFEFDGHANLGRVTSLIDITSQIGKGILGTGAGLALAGYRVFKGVAFIACGYFKSGVESLGDGFFTALGAIGSLVWRVFMVVADVLGVFLPEIGRWARHWNTAFNMLGNETGPIPVEPLGNEEQPNRSEPPREHTFIPQADLGRVAFQAALATLGLKEGVTFAEVKQRAHQLFRENHPDKGGDAEAFKAVRRAFEGLRNDQRLLA